MTRSGFPAGSIMDQMSSLTPEEKVIVANYLAHAVQDRGSATVADFDAAMRFIGAQSSWFFAHLHGGPLDGQVMRMPQEHASYIGVPIPDREVTRAEIADATVLGMHLDFPITVHGYSREEGTGAPLGGEHANFHYVGASPAAE